MYCLSLENFVSSLTRNQNKKSRTPPKISRSFSISIHRIIIFSYTPITFQSFGNPKYSLNKKPGFNCKTIFLQTFNPKISLVNPHQSTPISQRVVSRVCKGCTWKRQRSIEFISVKYFFCNFMRFLLICNVCP